MATTFDEPQVIVNTSYGDTTDNSLASLNGLICAAPFSATYVDVHESIKPGKGTKWNPWTEGEWYRLYQKGSRTKFLLECTNSNNGTLSKFMSEDIFNIYRLLGSMSVLVLRINPLGRDSRGIIVQPDNLAAKYGTGTYTSFSGQIGVTDKGKSVLLDNNSNLIDKKFTFQSVNSLDINTLAWTDIVDNLGDRNIYLLNYHYDVNGKLNGEFGYSSAIYPTTTPTEMIAFTTEITASAVQEIYISGLELGAYNFIVAFNNLIGLTETRDHIPVLKAKVDGAITTAGDIDTIPLKLTIDDRTETYNIKVNNSTKRLVEFGNRPLGANFIVNANYLSSDVAQDERVYTSFIRGTAGPSGPSGPSVNEFELAATAINNLVDFDEGYRVDFIFDSGKYNKDNVHNAMASVADKINALGVATVDEVKPQQGQNFNDLANALTVNNQARLYKISPRREVDFGGYKVKLSLGIDYLECVARNKANLQEFAPVFHFTNAYVADSNLTKYYTKSEREKLLEKRINSVKRDKFRGISYINDNKTTLTSTTSLGNEEQIVRLANRMAWDIQYILDQFLGRLDVKATANAVKNEIKYYYQSTFSNQRYSPENIEIICDESNNRFGDGELVVTVNIYVGRALKKITVYNNILPLTSYE